MSDAIQQQATIPDQFISDIVDTACEGGINYWCARVNGTFKVNVEESTPVAWDFYEIDAKRPIHVTAELLRKTLDDILTGRIDCDEALSQSVADALVEPEDIGVYIDAAYADCIVQFACFGEQRYG